jgi:hypothetical protein
MRWVGNVACIGEVRNTYKILIGRPEGKRWFVRFRLRVQLKWILIEIGGRMENEFIWFRINFNGWFY